jgi:carboxyl-terminal processing protease
MKKAIPLALILGFAVFFLTSDSDAQWQHQLDKYRQIYKLLKENCPETPDTRKIVFASIHGLLKTLDPHSYFLDPPMLRSMMEDQQGNYYGIGIRITKYENRLTILSLIKDTPAFKHGLQPGDVITEIESQSTASLPLDQIVRKLRGPKSSQVSLKVQRQGINKPLLFRIKRAEIPLNSISYSLSHPTSSEIGYISIRTFGKTTANEFSSNLNHLIRQQGVRGLILDLRGNSGGLLQAAIKISDFFLEKGKTVVSIKGRNREQKFLAVKNSQFEGFPLVILINRQSASASEIVASALKDHHKATIIGSRSWGKGLVETVHQLPLNCAMALTSAKYYTPENKSLQRDYREYDQYFSILQDDGYDHNTSLQGGVFPDIQIKDDRYPPSITELISKGIFFQFSRKLMTVGIPISKNFSIDATITGKFKKFLKEKQIQFSPELFKKHVEIIQYEIKRDILTHQFSALEGIKVFLERDPVIRKAVGVLMKKLEKGARTWRKQTILSSK